MSTTKTDNLDTSEILVVPEETGLREGLYIHTGLDTVYLLLQSEFIEEEDIWVAYDINDKGRYNTHISDSDEWLSSIESGELVPAVAPADSEVSIPEIKESVEKTLDEKW